MIMKITKLILTFAIIFSLVLPFSTGSAQMKLDNESAGDDVFSLQSRLYDLGYVAFRATGRYRGMTEAGILYFQSTNGLPADGICGQSTWDKLYTPDALRQPINPNFKRVYGPTTTVYEEFGELTEWNEIDGIFPVGKTATVYDYKTSTSFKVQRNGGTNHADVEVLTSADHDAFLKCFGGEYTWEKRPMIIEIDGILYACSVMGSPNSNDQIEGNGMPGAVDMYFHASASDIGGIGDAEHSSFVLQAAGRPNG